MKEYKGVPFSKAQLVFVVEAAMAAAIDRIETGLPSGGTPLPERVKIMNVDNPREMGQWDYSTLETCGMMLGIFYAQLTGDGLGVGDAIDFKPKGKLSLREVAQRFINKAVKNAERQSKGSPFKLADQPNVHSLAKAWVKEIFVDYILD